MKHLRIHSQRNQTERLIFKLVAIQLMKSHSRSTVFIGDSTDQGLVDMLPRNYANTCYDGCASGLLIKTIYDVSANAGRLTVTRE